MMNEVFLAYHLGLAVGALTGTAVTVFTIALLKRREPRRTTPAKPSPPPPSPGQDVLARAAAIIRNAEREAGSS